MNIVRTQRGFEGRRRWLAGRGRSLFLLLAGQSLGRGGCGRCCVSFQLLLPLLQEDSVLLRRQTGRTQMLCMRHGENNIFPPWIIRWRVWWRLHMEQLWHNIDSAQKAERWLLSSSSSLWWSPFTDAQCMTSFLDGLIKIWTATRYYSSGRVHIHPPGTNTLHW